jgi:hypothetical protein
VRDIAHSLDRPGLSEECVDLRGGKRPRLSKHQLDDGHRGLIDSNPSVVASFEALPVEPVGDRLVVAMPASKQVKIPTVRRQRAEDENPIGQNSIQLRE